ncbi:MAG: hypothetical protein EOO40_00215 [Deltaproteobacteria bacterium]|nr:MAG: hypothetical protein EOO40_00215 [Deltaproteobacteria bacterium]
MSDVLKRLAAMTVKGDGKKACWLFMGHRNRAGFGCISYRGKPRLAHRVVAEERGMLLASWQFVSHTCFTPACVRPDHLQVHDQRPVLPPKKRISIKMHAKGLVNVQYTLPSKIKGKRRKRVNDWVKPEQAKRLLAKYGPKAPKERFCGFCKTSMGTLYVRNKYCGQSCVNAAYYAAHPDPELPPCPVCCGKVTYKRQTAIQNTMCSKACRAVYQGWHLAKVRPKARVYLKVCLICSKPYVLGTKHNVLTCSKKCAGKLMWRRRRKQCVVCEVAQATRQDGKEPICAAEACRQTLAVRHLIVVN